nr:PREDICTED: serpin E3-like [Bos indicus]
MQSLLLALLLLPVCSPGGASNLHEDLTLLRTDLALRLYRIVALAGNQTNLVLSPAGAFIPLELLQFGARGNTGRQLAQALGYTVHDPKVREWLQTVYAVLPSTNPGAKLELACTLYVQTGTPLAPCFVDPQALPSPDGAELEKWAADKPSISTAHNPLCSCIQHLSFAGTTVDTQGPQDARSRMPLLLYSASQFCWDHSEYPNPWRTPVLCLLDPYLKFSSNIA